MGWFTKKIVIALAMIFSIYLIYGQTLTFDFINFDDPVYVTDNPAVTQGLGYESLGWAFGIHGDICMYYQPIAWISHMADCQFFGLDPGRHHRTSVILHGINAILLFLILNSLTGAFFRSAFAAFIFALHPVNTDAVVWIAERKTILSAFFWLLAMGSYIRYTRRPSAGRMVPVTAFFFLGMFTKPVLITFPFAMMLLDIWPLCRVRLYPNPSPDRMVTVLTEKIPLFLIIGLWCITPYLSQTLLANETPPDVVPYGLRISNVFVSYSKYVLHFFFPFNLSILYPYPKAIPLWQTLSAFAFLTGITVYSLIRFRSKPFLVIGWLWFAGTLVPTSGLILGTLWPEMADRWAYIPYMGLALITAWGLPELLSRMAALKRHVTVAAALIFLAYLGYLAHRQTACWENSIRIFENALTVIDYHALPHQNIATEWIKKGVYEKAEKHLAMILEKKPDHVDALYNMGICKFETQHMAEALNYFDRVLTLDPGFARAWLLKAKILEHQGRDEAVIALLEKALDHTIRQNDILRNLALTLSRNGYTEEADQRFMELVSAYPRDPRGHGAYSDFLLSRQSYDRALRHARKQTDLSPASTYAFNRLGLCYIHLGNFSEAIECFQQAIDLDDRFMEAKANLKTAQNEHREVKRAMEAIIKSLSLDEGHPLPRDPDQLKQWLDKKVGDGYDSETGLKVYGNLAGIYRLYGQYEKALALYDILLSNHPDYQTSLSYNMACLYALLRRPRDAAAHLAVALKNDPSLTRHVEKDPDFNLIRKDPLFVKLFESYVPE